VFCPEKKSNQKTLQTCTVDTGHTFGLETFIVSVKVMSEVKDLTWLLIGCTKDSNQSEAILVY